MTFGFTNAHSSNTPNQENIFGEFELSTSEKEDIENFLNTVKTSELPGLDGIMKASLAGNPIAMWTLGQCYLGGLIGASLNHEAAYLQFRWAASLGYAPALFEIFRMYAHEKQDPYMAFVYLNLTISSGHPEYREFYYQQRDKFSKLYGGKIFIEIERIALEKIIKISEIRDKISGLDGTSIPSRVLLGNDITSSDFIYNDEYWEQFFEKE